MTFVNGIWVPICVSFSFFLLFRKMLLRILWFELTLEKMPLECFFFLHCIQFIDKQFAAGKNSRKSR